MEQFKGRRLFFYNLSTAGHALFDSLLLTFYLNFLLPPKEQILSGEMIQFLPDKVLGFIPVVGIIMVAGRIVDAIADPLIASYSDRSHSRWGRRRTFLIFSGIPLALSTILVFFPPVADVSMINLVYLCFTFALFFLFYTMYVAPYIALIPELGHTEHQRLGIATAQGYFALIGGAIAMIGGPMLIGLFSKYTLINAYRYMIITLSVIGIFLLYSAVFAVDEKRYSNAKPSSVALKDSITKTLSNKHFLIFLAGYMSMWFVFNVLRSSAVHIGVTLMNLSVEEAGFNFILLFVVAGISFIGIMKLAEIIGKNRVIILGMLLFALFTTAVAFTGLLPVDPNLYGKIFFALCGIPTAILLVLPNVYIAELCDYDYNLTGERREGMYFGVNGFFMKLNLGISTALISFFFVQFGKDIASPNGVRFSLIAGAIVVLLGLLVFLKYPAQLKKEE